MKKILYQIFTALILIQFQTLVASSNANDSEIITIERIIDDEYDGTYATKTVYKNRSVRIVSDTQTRTIHGQISKKTYYINISHIPLTPESRFIETDFQDKLVTHNSISGQTQKIDRLTGEIVP